MKSRHVFNGDWSEDALIEHVQRQTDWTMRNYKQAAKNELRRRHPELTTEQFNVWLALQK